MTRTLLCVLALALSACARTSADSVRAEIIPAPASGYTCFAIMNGDNQPVGGNCVRE